MCKKRGYLNGTDILEDCLSCGNSMSEEVNEQEDRLYCMDKEEHVDDNDWCEKYN